jgi:hypothetical protein
MTGDTAGEAPASSLLLVGHGQPEPISRDCLVEITVPVYNEQKILAPNIRRLHSYLTGNLPFHFVIGHSDLATGSRLAHGATVVRSAKREIISRSYNLLLRTVLSARFTDAQCGFKAGRAEVIRALLPEIKDDAWFFDTELLIAAQRKGLRIYQVPVVWTEDPDSKVDIAHTALADLRGVARLRFTSSKRRGILKSPGLPRPSAPAQLNAPEQPR